ncbi:MAG TPA: hypothetical protein VI979_04710 [archaeon]|nr:hypothetical protein [archaeon]
MLHLNEEKKRIGLLGIGVYFAPQQYHATTIQEFNTEKDGVVPTSGWLPPAVFYRGKAMIHFATVNYSRDDRQGCLWDATGNMSLEIPRKYQERGPEELREGRVYNVWISYDTSTNGIKLVNAKDHGPKRPAPAPGKLNSLRNLAYSR